MIALLVIFFFVLVRFGSEGINKRTQESNKQKLSGITQKFREMEREISDVTDSWFQKNSTAAEMMSSSLRTLTDGSSYDGPEIFDDGVVIRVEGDQIIYPEGFRGFLEGLDPGESWDDVISGILHNSQEDEDTEVYLTLRPIAGKYYYADWTKVSEYDKDVDEIFNRMNSMIHDMENSYGGYFLVVGKNDGKLLYASSSLGNFDEGSTLEDLGLSPEDFDNETPSISINGKQYSASYRQMRFMGTPARVFILIDENSEVYEVKNISLLMVLLIGFIAGGLILWQYWVQRHVQDHSLSEAEIIQYHPRKVRTITLIAALAGAIVIFFFSLFYQALQSLSNEAVVNGEIIKTVSAYVNKISNEKTMYQINEEVWTKYYAERTAELMSANARLRTREALSAINRSIGSDFIMLFDENGREIISSNSYAGFKLGREGSKSSADFLRLLLGVDTIILAPEMDLTIEKNIQQTGSSVDLGKEKFGALIISFDAEESWEAAARKDIKNYLKRVTSSGKLCVIKSKDPDSVLYSSDEDVIEPFSSGYELKKGDRESSDMDIFTISDTKYLGPFNTEHNFTYFYLTRQDNLQSNSKLLSSVLAAGYLVIVILVSLIMIGSYTPEKYNDSVKILTESRLDSVMDSDRTLSGVVNKIDLASDTFKSRWSSMSPEQRIGIYMQALAGVMLIIMVVGLPGQSPSIGNSAITFVMRGDWQRGINMMSTAAIFILIMAYIIFLFFKGLLEGILYSVLDAKEKTVMRLVLSLLQYTGIFGVIFASMDYLGINTTVMLAGFSAFSLAVSLGGKDLVADILAGIFIIFEDEFHVGDYIEVGGFSGIVQEIGVRSTKILGLGDNIKIIGNQDVKNVLNKSKMNTWYTLDFNIKTDQKLTDVEEILNKELPKIGRSIPEIISGPYYKGVWAINSSTYTLSINCECKESDSRIVQRNLNHALILLFEKNDCKFG